jgi:hypothetical protein
MIPPTFNLSLAPTLTPHKGLPEMVFLPCFSPAQAEEREEMGADRTMENLYGIVQR